MGFLSKWRGATWILCVVMGGCATAQPPLQAAGSHADLASEYARLQVNKEVVDVSVEAASLTMGAVIATSLQANLGRPISGDEVARVNRICHRVMVDLFPLAEWQGALAPVYQGIYSETELHELIAFSGTPLGQKVLATQAAAFKLGQAAGARMIEAKAAELQTVLRNRVDHEFPGMGNLVFPGN